MSVSSWEQFNTKRAELESHSRQFVGLFKETGVALVEGTRSSIDQKNEVVLGKLRELEDRGQEWLKSVEHKVNVEAIISKVQPAVDEYFTFLNPVIERVQEFVSGFAGDEVITANINDIIPNYDDLNVKKVAEALQPLSSNELLIVRDYELSNKERITVTKEIDLLLAN